MNSALPLITANNLAVRRQQSWLLHDINLTLFEGEIVTLIGPNGSGKSTLVEALLGIIPITSGTITRHHELTIGYVPQKLNIDSTMPITVKRFLQLTKTKPNDLFDTIIQLTHIENLLHKNMQHLSGGEHQRVLLTRALLTNPHLLVLDEPVQGVDYHGEIALYQLINDARDLLKCGILLISHDLHIVMKNTDKVLCLNRHICCQGTPLSVMQNKEYHALFGSQKSDLLAFYQHDHDHSHHD